MDPSFLVALSLTNKKCLVVGTSPEADYRTEQLARAGAEVSRVSGQAFGENQLDGVWLCELADRDADLAARIGHACESQRILFCAVDQPSEGNFRHVAVARAGRVQIGISTDGSAPALAKKLRQELERVITDAGLSEFAERVATLRDKTASAERAQVLAAAVRELHFDGKLELGS